MRCACGRAIRRVTQDDGIDLEWTHADDGEHGLFPGPLCYDGYQDDATGQWVDPPYAEPADG